MTLKCDVSDIHEHCVDIDNRIIYLHGDEMVQNEEPGVDYRMSSRFIKNINILSLMSGDPIIIHMNTVGGEWSYGMAIYDSIRNCKCHTTVIAHSWARSMSSIILQAANVRVLTKHSVFMAHWGTSDVSGHYTAVKSAVEFDARTENIMIDIYVQRCINSKQFMGMQYNEVFEFIKGKINEKSDWWLSADEALNYGFVDKIL